MLSVEGLQAAYGDSRVLFGIDLSVARGEVVTLLGRNGMGKTTTVRSIFGLLRPSSGKVSIEGRDLTAAAPHLIARAGLGLVPEGRQVFAPLTTEENLIATARTRGKAKWTLDRVYALFPRLKERRRNMGDQLSGGEQQMLAVGRALMTNPALLVLDEATEGLAPLIREEIWSCLRHLKDEGEAILVIDKNVDALVRFADRHVVIEKGKVVWTGTTPDLIATPDVKSRFLQV
ncbi:ABC transporter ATP-binding protein [Paracoccus caeni]|uniref:ABC transporter ATP-binding protein n=1 Tax=Paracoccus caeni TaxID=657651 RepID=A0A934SII8_9RHOB|nr:ABC transporter ATP-binding protein [Paracoccus caeni]MBK4215083.1 ABC transporter ATP-binding protein [Paracoccus caeni]